MRLSISNRIVAALSVTAVVIAASFVAASDETTTAAAKGVPAKSTNTITMVVMDPLAKPLSCPCVAGYAQRDYDLLGAALEKSLGRKVKVVYNESLKGAMKKDAAAGADIVIGKESVILSDAKAVGAKLAKVAMLTGKDGLTTQTGLIVVPSKDPAKSVADLAGYRMYFGPAECDEKHAAAVALLKKHNVALPEKLDTAVACDEGANKILELATKGERGCAVISSYAKPLLEGCGQVKKGDLRVVGETAPVPFIAAFVSTSIDAADQKALATALHDATKDAALRIALETKVGFVSADAIAESDAKPKAEAAAKVSESGANDGSKKK
jgi:ABC-type phosphate/phosphonate transport system substrate-binding protein